MKMRESVFRSLPTGNVVIGGLVGERIDRCIENRVMTQDIERLVKPYRERSDGPDGFRGEFWGKWFTSLVLAYTYRPCPEIKAKLDEAARMLMETQTADGCISTYPYPDQHGMWDVWSRKYALLGLVHYYEVTGEKAALDAASRMLEHFCTQVGPGKVRLADSGHWAWKGLPPSSFLEPVAILYRLTGKKAFGDFAQWIVNHWNEPSVYLPEGLQLVDKALDVNVPARETGNPKGYEQMSCFEGLCELYRADGERRYLDAAIALAHKIREQERMIVGSGANHEMWFNGARYQTETLEQPIETCVTATWMKLCARLLELTGDLVWADELELSLFNALPAAMTPDGSWWSYYSPLTGERVASHFQYTDIGLSCCVASGPRAMLLTHRWAVMQDDAGPVVNLYAPGTARFSSAKGGEVEIQQTTEYPKKEKVVLTIRCAQPEIFKLRLRIPAWSRNTLVSVNGKISPVTAGKYHSIERTWKDGDTVELVLDMRTRAVPAPSGAPQFALVRGPLVLALDNRLAKASRKTARLIVDADGYVDTSVPDRKPDNIFLTCEVPFVYHKVHIVSEPETLTFCDYASAGNEWSGENLFRVWLPQPLFMEQAFIPDTWKLMYPDDTVRPEIPSCRNDFE
jgi:DUF1680 family protein